MTMWKTVRNDFVNEYSINIKFFFPKRITTFFRSPRQYYELWILCMFFSITSLIAKSHDLKICFIANRVVRIFAEENKKHSKTFAAICTPTKRIERMKFIFWLITKHEMTEKKLTAQEKKIIETKIRRIKRWKALLSRLKIDSPLITSVMWMSYRRIDNIITVVDLVCCSFSVVVWLPIFCVFFSFFSFSLSDAKC